MTNHRPDATYTRRPEFNAVEMDGELVMMGQEQGEYYGLRDVAASIWKNLEEAKTLDDLVGIVSSEYAVSPETCRADIVRFLEDLADRKLINIT